MKTSRHFLPHGGDALGGEAELRGPASDGGDEVPPGFGRVGFDLVGVHMACFGKYITSGNPWKWLSAVMSGASA
jgi:hypothetical protein